MATQRPTEGMAARPTTSQTSGSTACSAGVARAMVEMKVAVTT